MDSKFKTSGVNKLGHFPEKPRSANSRDAVMKNQDDTEYPWQCSIDHERLFTRARLNDTLLALEQYAFSLGFCSFLGITIIQLTASSADASFGISAASQGQWVRIQTLPSYWDTPENSDYSMGF